MAVILRAVERTITNCMQLKKTSLKLIKLHQIKIFILIRALYYLNAIQTKHFPHGNCYLWTMESLIMFTNCDQPNDHIKMNKT